MTGSNGQRVAPARDGGALPTLDYRSPAAAPSGRVERIVRELAMAETPGGAAVAMKIAAGVPLSLVGPFLVASAMCVFDRRLGAGVVPGFGATFLLVTVVLVPLLMWLERRSRGEFFLDAVRGEASPLAASSYGEYELQSTKFGWMAWTEIALTGPRLLWEVIDGYRGRVAGDPRLRVLAAEVTAELLDAGEGLPMRQLVRPDRPASVLARAVDYLMQRGWADVSSRRDRVWLATPVRERLARLPEGHP